MSTFNAKTDTPATGLAAGDKFPFGDVSADGWDTITAQKLLKALSAVTDDAAGVLADLGGGAGSGSTLLFASQNADSTTIVAGSPVAAQTPGVARAKASDSTRPAIGLALATAGAGSPLTVVLDGVLTLADWSAVLGSVSLSPRQLYFVDPSTPGKIATAVPTATGQVVQVVGVGLTSDTIEIQIGQPILL